jgi:hypothetical protein
MLPEQSTDFVETFTDIEGEKHSTTVPRGKVRPEIWGRVREDARTLISPALVELLDKTDMPFVSAIRDLDPSKGFLCDGKLLLVGDAFALCRPHMGAAVNRAALQIQHLETVFQGESSLEDWETKSVEEAEKVNKETIAFGMRFMGEAVEAAQGGKM